MDGTILDPDGARAHLAAWQGRIDKMAQDTEAMRQQLQQLRVTASDPHGLSEVSIDSTGALVGLRLTERIAQVAPDVVAQTIMTTLGEARTKLADQSREIIADTVGTESAAAKAIAQSVDRHLRRDPTEDDTGDTTEQPPPRRRGRADDADANVDADGTYDISADIRNESRW
ncbi:YbaB/EbfC family nucleoid-associated protein [Actinophytocola sediminis]